MGCSIGVWAAVVLRISYEDGVGAERGAQDPASW